MIDESDDVIGHAGAVVGGWGVELGRGAVPAIVERDDAAAGAGESRNPAGMNPVHLGGRGKTVHEHDGRALTLIEKGDFDAVVSETLHATLVVPGVRAKRGQRPGTHN